MAATSINRMQFYQLLAGEQPVLVDFWAPWCRHCRQINDPYDRIAAKYENRLLIVKVNTDEEPQLTGEEWIEIIPTLVLYRNGIAVDSIVAPDSEAMIDRFIREALEK